MYFFTNLCTFDGLHRVAQIKLIWKTHVPVLYTVYSGFMVRVLKAFHLFDCSLWFSMRLQNDKCLQPKMMEWVVFPHLRHFSWSCFLMEKDNPLENRIKDPTLFCKETDGNLFGRQSDMKLLYGQNIKSIAWKSGNKKSHYLMEHIFGYPAIFLHNPFDLQHVVNIKGQI